MAILTYLTYLTYDFVQMGLKALLNGPVAKSLCQPQDLRQQPSDRRATQ